ncbi:Hint domain-containing protein [Palleronia abyssalis]|uniref:Hedgehog/Intein (Hint) domain-containing protein n=1 Tax=Palleronia abyssalis TaxID=1501240 RepID=A0A2R8BX32_9RHOB|nr:Hint domain-containing protein [Palleronia abyssalis]SPJ24727.1 hypothetical protein PAA8504_02565 [Palleronia abyssalis]
MFAIATRADRTDGPTLDIHASGLVSGTRVATTVGWRPVETILPGDGVLTFDEGMQTVIRAHRSVLWDDPLSCPPTLWPLRVPVGALGNQSQMLLLPEQPVLLESDTAEEIFGDPFTVMPALALDGFRGICREKPVTRVEVISLCFKVDQVIFANIGAMFYCPRVLSGEARADFLEEARYTSLTIAQGETLASIIEMDEARAIA